MDQRVGCQSATSVSLRRLHGSRTVLWSGGPCVTDPGLTSHSTASVCVSPLPPPPPPPLSLPPPVLTRRGRRRREGRGGGRREGGERGFVHSLHTPRHLSSIPHLFPQDGQSSCMFLFCLFFFFSFLCITLLCPQWDFDKFDFHSIQTQQSRLHFPPCDFWLFFPP